MNRGEISSSAIASAPNVGLADDLTHRTPHFGYTSELRLHHESVPILSAKTKDTADSRFRQDSQSVHAKDSHDRASRERGNSSTRGRQESVRCCCLSPTYVMPILHFHAAGAVSESSRFICGSKQPSHGRNARRLRKTH